MENIKLKEVISAVFEIDINSITPSTSPEDVDNWDSMGHLNLVLALEEEFNISIPDEDVGNLLSVRLIEIIIDELTK